jgi:secondary thiamine-phosphate synthase enzyme
MIAAISADEKECSAWKIYHDSIGLRTQECLEFIDVTGLIVELVHESGVRSGIVNIQTKHTTTAIVVNENEPLLLEDMRKILEKLAPKDGEYQHNDFEIRTVNLLPGEDENGHSHCKAMLLGASETLNIVDGAIQLGQWQRIFFVELDKGKRRVVSVVIIGSET